METKAVEIIFKLKDLFTTQVTKVTGAFKRTESASSRSADAIKRNNKQAAKSFGGLTRGISTVTTKLLALASASLTLIGLKRAFEGVVGTGSEFERLAVQMEAVTGSAEKGEEAFAWVKEFAKNTPFQLDQVGEAFVKLTAFGIDPTNGSMQAIADQAAKLGGSQETLNGIILAVGQAWAKQKLQGEEILQLVERGVPVWDLLSKATGKNVLELQKLSAAGKLGRTEISLLIEEIGKASDGAAAKSMNTMAGLVSNLKDSWEEFKNTVAKAGVFEFAKDQIELLRDKIAEMSKNGELQKLATRISNAMIRLAEGFKNTARFVVNYADELKAAAAVMVAMKVTAFAQTILGVGKAFIAAARGVKVFKVALVSTGIGAVAVALGELTGAAYNWITASKKTVDTTGDLINKYEDLAKAEREKVDAKKVELKAQKEVNRITKEAFNLSREQLTQSKKVGDGYREQAEEMVKAALAAEGATTTSTDKQIAALNDYEKALEDAQQKTRSTANEFQELINEMQAGPEKVAKELNTIDFAESITNAQQALNAGDFNGAIDGARQTADMLRRMKEAGVETDTVLTGLAQQLKRLTDAAANGQETKIETAATEAKNQLNKSAEAPAELPIIVNVEEARRQIELLRQEAGRPIITTIETVYTNKAGNSFSDRQNNTQAIFREEALKKGKR